MKGADLGTRSRKWIIRGFLGLFIYFLVFFVAALRLHVGTEKLDMIIVGGDFMIMADKYDGREGPKKPFSITECIYWTGFGLTSSPQPYGAQCRPIYRAYPLF